MSQVELIKKKRLYKIAQQLQVKKPWDFFEDIGILAITLPNRKTPFYCVFLYETIVVCPNQAALKGLFYLSEQNIMPEIQRLRYQQHLICYFVEANEFSEVSSDSMDDLGIEAIDHKLPVFESAMPGVLPDELIKAEIQTMIDVLKQVETSMDEMQSIKALNHSIDTHMVHRYFDFDQKEWNFDLLDMVEESLDVKPLDVEADLLSKAKQQNSLDEVWEIDVAYTPLMVEKKEGHRQGVVRVLLLANTDNQQIYNQQLITLKDDANRMLVDNLVASILNHGLPKEVIVRDSIVAMLIENISSELNLNVVVNQKLPTIDLYVEQLSEQTLQETH